ncbi:MAG: transglutaminase family protein [Planctomycetaceae bacterium]
MTRRRQSRYITVLATAAVVSVLVYLFPDVPRAKRPKTLQAQSPGVSKSPRVFSGSRPATNRRPDSGGQDGAQFLEDVWQVIYLHGRRIGYSRTVFERLTEGSEIRIRTTTEMQMSFKRFGQVTQMRSVMRTVETAAGDLLSFESENGKGRRKTRMTGRLSRGRMIVETFADGRRGKRVYDWRDGIKSPTYQDRLVRTFPMKPGEIRRFKTFLPELGRVTEVRLSAGDFRNKRLHTGRRRKLLRVRVTQSVSPTEVVYAYLDKNGLPVVTESEMVGSTLAHYTVSRAEALKAMQGAELDLGLKTVIRTARIKKPRKQTRIVYRIAMTNDDPAKYLAADDRQTIRRIDKRTIELAVTASKLPRRNVHVRIDQEFLAPSRTLQTNDRRVREHARRAAGYQTDPAKIARAVERYVSKKLTNKNFSTAMATAADVARDMQGDCTEHAVLMAAMLRTRRVASRIAIGLVYDEWLPGFVSHMWTEAWIDGHWVAFDATRGEGKVGPTHIKLSDASFSDKSAAPVTAFLPLMNVIGKWRIDVLDTGERIADPRDRFPRR